VSTKKKINIEFTCILKARKSQTRTAFLFYPKGSWDEKKRSLVTASKKYPQSKYNWVYFSPY